MNKVLAVTIMILIISVSTIATTGNTVKKVDIPVSSGTTLYVGGSGPNNYSKIQDAIDNASNGDTVFIYNDSLPYYENLIIDKSLFIKGENKKSTVINGGGIDDVVYISANNVSISDLTVENSGFFGYAKFDLNGTLVDIFSDAGIEISSNSNIIFNVIIGYECGDGILIKNSYSNCIFDNEINKDVILINVSDNILSNNNISNSNIGISLLYSIKNTIHENNIQSNDLYGLSLNYSSNYNKIYHNNLFNNTQNAYDECYNSWNNSYPSCGNYWDDYTGEDYSWGTNQNIPGRDGVGDSPHDLPCEYATDYYPLMEPYGMTELSLTFRGGLFKYSSGIKNIGNHTAFNVHWKITLDGGFILLGRNYSGILKPLLPNEEAKVSSLFVFGFGPILLTASVWADNAPKVTVTRTGHLFFFFLQINPGGGI